VKIMRSKQYPRLRPPSGEIDNAEPPGLDEA
jgi:hypothetical protein